MTSFTPTTLNYPQLADTALRRVKAGRSPTTADSHNFQLGDEWLNTTAQLWWKLVALSNTTGALWVALSGSGAGILTINNVPGTGNNITLAGTSPITISNNIATSTVTIGLSGSVATSYITSSGSATPSGNVLNVLGGTGIATSGSGNTITIALTGSVSTQFNEDSGSATPSAGILTIAGGTGISTSGAGSTVTINAAGSVPTTFNEDSGSATPSANVLKIVGGTGVSTSGSGNTVTINAASSVPTTFNEDSGSATPSANILKIVGGSGITTSGSGNTVTIASTGTSAYTNVTHAMSPYTVLITDFYLSVDTSGGVVTLNFPNSPTAKQTWIVKDRTGTSATNNISVTTPSGTVTFDGQTTYTIKTAYEAINLLADTTPAYEIF